MIKNKFRALLVLLWAFIAFQNFYFHNTAIGVLGLVAMSANVYLCTRGPAKGRT